MADTYEQASAPETVSGAWLGADLEPGPTGPPVTPQGSARSILLTVLAELLRPATAPVWTSALLHVLTGLGLEENTARQALARSSTAGWITAEKLGRESRWRLTEDGASITDDLSLRAESMSTLGDTWDANCLILLVTVPQEQKAVRKRLYTELGWAGFGNPMPGLWASPHLDREGELRALIDELGLRNSTLAFVGTTISIGISDAEIVRRAWDLETASAKYEALIKTFENLSPEPGDATLFSYLTLSHEWRQFPYMDPQLPEDLLPDWIGRRATELFTGLRAQWADGARTRWREITEGTPTSL